jgi:pimeloyl-ACP methyl ester carboxylesterase
VIAQAPITNLVAAGQPADALMGGAPHEYPDRYARCDPTLLLPLGTPLLLVHGAGDATVPIQRTREYAAAARAAGDDVTLLEPNPGGHRSHLDPRSAAWRVAAEWLDEARDASPQAARRT